jgi:hypothetical protein
MNKIKLQHLLVLLFLAQNLLISQTEQNSILYLKNELKSIETDKISTTSEIINFNIEQKKNTGLAILYSLLLPGMGELYAEGYDSGIYFTIADGVLWTTVIGMNVYGNWQEDRYKSYAKVHAGIDPNGKDKDFFATISAYSSIDDYNNEKAFERDFKSMLDKQKYYWNWNSNEDRRTYRNMWSSSEQTFNNIRFAVGGLILNRLISVINAVRLTSRYNKKIKDDGLTMNVFIRKNVFNESELTFNFLHKF